MSDAYVDKGDGQPIFRPGGNVGPVCDGNAVCLSVLGSAAFVAVSKLRQFGIYEVSTLRLTFISLPLVSNIRCIAAKYENIIVVLENNSLLSFYRYESNEIKHSHTSDIMGIEVFDDVLVTYSNSEIHSFSKVENKDSKILRYKLDKQISVPDAGTLTTLLRFEGFKNKVLLGCSNGTIHLCNVVSGNIIHTFNFDVPQNDFILDMGVTTFAQSNSRASGIIAIGYKNGYVGVADAKGGQVLGGFLLAKQQHFATSLLCVDDTFKVLPKDEKGNTGEALLVGCENGDLVVFDLLNFTGLCTIPTIHIGPVKHLLYHKNANLVVSSGSDNCLIQWTCDSDKTLLREVKSRCGFIGNVNFIIPYDHDELDLIVCSQSNGVGYLAKACTIQEHQCKTFSTKCSKTKVKPISAIAAAYQRHYDWPNIVTCHSNSHVVRVWSGFRKCLVEGTLRAPGSNATATSVAVTKCGNFVVVGYQNGQMHLFHLQSCNHEQEFTLSDHSSAHDCAIVNLEMIGGTTIQSVSIEKGVVIKSWDISSCKLASQYNLDIKNTTDGKVTAIHVGSMLTALATSSGKIYICDVVGRTIVRVIDYKRQVVCMSFHPNGTWFLASGKDSTMIVYDILAACFVDFVKFENPVVAMHNSKCGAFLDVSIQDSHGCIHRLLNRHCFEIQPRRILYRELNSKPVDLTGSAIKTQEETETADKTSDCKGVDEPIRDYTSKTEAIEKGLLTLSGMSNGKLQNILYLDEIKSASKPIEPPKIQNELPFFIPTAYKDGQLVFVEPKDNVDPLESLSNAMANKSRIRSGGDQSDFDKLIASKLACNQKFDQMLKYLLNQTPAAVHLTLSLVDVGDEPLATLLHFFNYHVQGRENADAVQVFLNIFLQYHGEAIYKSKDKLVHDHLRQLSQLLSRDTSILQEHFESISCYLKFFSHLQME